MRLEAAGGDVIDSYLHIQGGRGVNGVLVVLSGGDAKLAHDVAVHIAFARPKYLTPRRRPGRRRRGRAGRRWRRSPATRASPSRRCGKIVEGRLQGFFKTVALLDQPYAKDDKQTVAQLVGDAKIVDFAQVEIG